MERKNVDLSSVTSRDLMLELEARGYYTDLICGIGDVDFQLDSINEDREEDDQIVMTKEQKIEVLDNCFYTEWYCDLLNTSISRWIKDNY